MDTFHLFLYLALLSVICNIVITMIIISELQKRKVKINFFLLRLYIPKYVYEYKKINLKETGKVSPLFYSWLSTINLAWILAAIGISLNS